MGSNTAADNSYRAGFLCRFIRRKGRELILHGLIGVRFGPETKGTRNINKLGIRFHNSPEFPVDTRFYLRKGLPFIKGFRLYLCSVRIDLHEALGLDLQNRLDLCYDGESRCSITYSLLWRRPPEFSNSRLFRIENKVLYFRQTVKNTIWFVVRPKNLYDERSRKYMVFLAWIVSKFKSGSGHILMYEKEASRYEESASVLYEALVDRGYGNVYYIIDRDDPILEDMPASYKKNLIYKDSFRHLVYFLSCNTFMGTENIDHAMQLRAANRHLMKKMQSTDLTHVFLQHGVMYMVSLDAESRIFFRNSGLKCYRAVVSSEAEATHFMLQGGFKREEIYITGLAKFDRSTREDDADRIMIMPTWRRWETNQAEKDFEGTGYYRMLERIVQSIPEDLREKVIIKPHPLMEKMMQKKATPLSKYLRPDLSHEETLRITDLLITDYSSIAYDAFYRGSNVIFFWEEKAECMKKYGNAHLMINEYNIFGDICYDTAGLSRAVRENYGQEQTGEHKRRYERIVAFHDNRNTERIIAELEKDGIVSRQDQK